MKYPFHLIYLRGLLLGLTEGEARSALSLSGRSVALHGGDYNYPFTVLHC